MAVDENLISRRDALRRAAAILGVGALSPAISSAVMAAAGGTSDGKPKFLSERQLETVATLAEIVIPTTDTPGARTAGVHLYIDTMLADYLSEAHRREFIEGLALVDGQARKAGFDSFLEADEPARMALVADMDRRVENPASVTSQRWVKGELVKNTPQRFFYSFKEMTIVGYYTSKIGASIELAYDPVPGQYSGCVPYESIGRAWST